MRGRCRWVITAVAIAIVVIAAVLIATQPNVIRDPPVSAFSSKGVTEDSVELTLTITPSTRASYLSIELIDEGAGSSAKVDLISPGVLQLADGRSFLTAYHDLDEDGMVANVDTVRINGPFAPGSYSIALVFEPTGCTICKTAFDVT